jgi:signal transduction histidine kinase
MIHRILPPDLSIRRKIVYSFYLLMIIIAGKALVTYGIVWRVEQRVEQAEPVSDLFNLTLEMRRYEKNYFLYEQEKDYIENLSYGEKLQDNISDYRHVFASLTSFNEVRDTEQALTTYMDRMHRLSTVKLSSEEGHSLLNDIRLHGKALTDFAEKASINQKESIHAMLRVTRQVLVISLCALFLLAIMLATFLARRISQSLKKLELYTGKIAQGEVLDIPVTGAELEIKAIIKAFNRMTHELRKRQNQLVQSEKLAAFGTLLAGIAHELNNPLSNISTSAQILGEEMGEDKDGFLMNLVAQIDEQADKARDIVRTLLDFSGAREFQRKEIELKRLLHETIRFIRGQVPTSVDIIVEVPEDLAIFADKQRIQQVFLNLIKNAVDALGETGHIRITSRDPVVHSDGRTGVEVLIEDNGPGIGPETLKKIYDPFFTTKDVGKGSGLGLFIVHEIIESHSGAIRVQSEQGQGTTFIIWLEHNKKENP